MRQSERIIEIYKEGFARIDWEVTPETYMTILDYSEELDIPMNEAIARICNMFEMFRSTMNLLYNSMRRAL